MTQRSYSEAVDFSKDLFDDLTFGYAGKWKEADPSRGIIGYLPMYIPRELIHSAGMLPVAIFGGGDRIPVVRGDAYFQSYICHLPRTVIEMALAGNMDDFDGFLFPAICDVIRNMSGIFRMQYPHRYVQYLDFPQNFDPAVGGKFYRKELERLIRSLKAINGVEITDDNLNRSITLYNHNRALIDELNDIRRDRPECFPTVDFYYLLRAGGLMPVEEHNDLLEGVRDNLHDVAGENLDRIRVIVSGSFCEQPPIGLIKTIENAGCYIVDDDFQLGMKWIQGAIEESGDPLNALVDAYLTQSTFSSSVYEADNPKGELLAEQVKTYGADGVIFCAPSFCDPALLDRPMLEQALDRHNVRHFNFQYHENLGQFHVIKEQAGTFADMIKLWES